MRDMPAQADHRAHAQGCTPGRDHSCSPRSAIRGLRGTRAGMRLQSLFLRSLTPSLRNYMPPPVLLEAPEEVEESQLYRETASQPMQPNAMDVAAATLKRARVDSGASHHSITPPMRLVPESPPAASTAQSSQTSHELDKAIGGRLR